MNMFVFHSSSQWRNLCSEVDKKAFQNLCRKIKNIVLFFEFLSILRFSTFCILIYLSVFYLSIFLFVCFLICQLLCSFGKFVLVSRRMPRQIFILPIASRLPVPLFVWLSIFLFVWLSIFLFVCLSVSLFVHCFAPLASLSLFPEEYLDR